MKYLSIAFLACLVLFSCGGSDDPDDPYTPTPNPPTPATQGKFFSMNCDMPAEASEKVISLTGLTSSITSQVQAIATPWLTVTQETYTSGTPKVKVACTQNLETKTRVMDIVFLSNLDKDTLLLTVKQAAYTGGGTNIDDINDTPTDKPAYVRRK